MSDSPHETIQALDLRRQRQIENQVQAINRLQEKLTKVSDIVGEAVAEGNNSTYIDRIQDVVDG